MNKTRSDYAMAAMLVDNRHKMRKITSIIHKVTIYWAFCGFRKKDENVKFP